jgi:hypothetical protein
MRLFVSLGCVALFGCGAGPLAAVRKQATADMHCDDAKLAVTQPKEGVNLFYVDGCGETRRYATICNVGGYCPRVEGQPVSAMIRKQASFDLRCDEAQISTQYLDVDTFGARGCDRQASYALICHVGPCRVVQNTQAQ